MRPFALLIALALAVLLLASACGGGGDEDVPDETVAPKTATERPTPSAAEIEADPVPDLPGEFVDLQTIYGAEYPDTAKHVNWWVDYESEQGLPPAGGPHWGRPCTDDPDTSPPLCGPAPWGVFRKPWPAETLVHNIEHAGVVLWYNTDDQNIIDELEELFTDRLVGDGQFLVMAPYPDMEEEHIALTAWGRRDKFSVSEYSRDRVEEFIDIFEHRFNPENF